MCANFQYERKHTKRGTLETSMYECGDERPRVAISGDTLFSYSVLQLGMVAFIIQYLVLMTLVTLSLSAPQVLVPTTQTNILRMDGVDGGLIFHYTRYCPRKVVHRAFLTCILGPDFSVKNAKNWTGTWIHPKIMEAFFWTGSLGRKTCIFPG